MADTPSDSNTNLEGTTLTSPPSEGSTTSAPNAPPNTIVGTMGNQIPNPTSISERLGAVNINSATATNAETQSVTTVVSAPPDIPAQTNGVQAHERYPEASTWATVAEEDLENALKRVAMAAKDQHENDPSKTVEEYYSETLAKIIKDGEIEFDVSAMDRA